MCFDSVRIDGEVVKLGIRDAFFVRSEGMRTPTPHVVLSERSRDREHDGELHCTTHSASHGAGYSISRARRPGQNEGVRCMGSVKLCATLLRCWDRCKRQSDLPMPPLRC